MKGYGTVTLVEGAWRLEGVQAEFFIDDADPDERGAIIMPNLKQELGGRLRFQLLLNGQVRDVVLDAAPHSEHRWLFTCYPEGQAPGD